jgi:ribosomal protein L24
MIMRKGDWVRVLSGSVEGSLGLIDKLSTNGQMVKIKIYTLMSEYPTFIQWEDINNLRVDISKELDLQYQ